MTVLVHHLGSEVRANSEWRRGRDQRSRGTGRSQSRRRRSASPRVGPYRRGFVAERKSEETSKEKGLSKADEEIKRFGAQLAGALVSGMLEDYADDETDDCIVGSDCSLSDADESEAESDVEGCSECSCDFAISAPSCYDEAPVSVYASLAKSAPMCFYVTKFKDVVSANYLPNNDVDGSVPESLTFGSGDINVAEEASLPMAALQTCEVFSKVSHAQAKRVPLEEQMLQMLRMLPQRPPVLALESSGFSPHLSDEELSVYDDDGRVDGGGRFKDWDSEGEMFNEESEMFIEESDDDAADAQAESDAVECLSLATRMANVAVGSGLIDVMDGESVEDMEFDMDEDCEEVPLATLLPLAPIASADCVDDALNDDVSGLLGCALSESLVDTAAPGKTVDPLETALCRVENVLVRSLDDGNLAQAMFQMMENREIARGEAELSKLVQLTQIRAEALAALPQGPAVDTEPSHRTSPLAEQCATKEPAAAALNIPGFAEAFSEAALGRVLTELAVVLDDRRARSFVHNVYTSILDLGLHVEAPVFDIITEAVETPIEQPCKDFIALKETLSKQLQSPQSKNTAIVRNLLEEATLEPTDLTPASSRTAIPAHRPSSRLRRSDPTKRMAVAKEDDFGNSAHDVSQSQSGSKMRGSLAAGSPAALLRTHRHAKRDAGKETAIAFAMDFADDVDTAPSSGAVRDCSITRGYEALGVQFHSLDSGEEASPAVSRASSRAGSAHSSSSRGHHEQKPPRSSRHASRSDHSSSHSSKSEKRRPSGSSTSRALSAMELDVGLPAAPMCSAITPKAPSSPSSSQMLRTASLGAVRLTKTRTGPGFLPMISSKSTSSLTSLPAASQRATSESFAWSGGSTRVRRNYHASGF